MRKLIYTPPLVPECIDNGSLTIMPGNISYYNSLRNIPLWYTKKEQQPIRVLQSLYDKYFKGKEQEIVIEDYNAFLWKAIKDENKL